MSTIWRNPLVSFAYQYQKEAKPFKDMMRVFAKHIEKRSIKSFLDIGCGSGRIIKLIVDEIKLSPLKITAIDVSSRAIKYAKENSKAFIEDAEINFIEADISNDTSFSFAKENEFDLVTAGLSIQYAQHWDSTKNEWSTKAYRRVLRDVYSILSKEGQFVFTVNVPNPNFSLIAKESKKEIFSIWWKIPFMLFVAIVMVIQGKWLTNEANKGRFLYLPIEHIESMLKETGFIDIKYELTYSGLAWVVSCRK